MFEFRRRAASRSRSAIAVLILSLAGCGERSALETVGISGLKPSTGWSPTVRSRFIVPGDALAAWIGPDGSSLVVASTLAAPKVTAVGLARELAIRYENLPELRIVKSETKKVGGVEAAYLEVLAPGTGDALAPTGLGRPIAPEGKSLVATRRISLGFPGPSRTLWLIWHAPETSAAALKTEVESAIKDMKIQDRASPSY